MNKIIKEGNISHPERARRAIMQKVNNYDKDVTYDDLTFLKTKQGNWQVMNGEVKLCLISKLLFDNPQSFKITPNLCESISDTPSVYTDNDFICREYNKIYGVYNNTHMVKINVAKSIYLITGSIFNGRKFSCAYDLQDIINTNESPRESYLKNSYFTSFLKANQLQLFFKYDDNMFINSESENINIYNKIVSEITLPKDDDFILLMSDLDYQEEVKIYNEEVKEFDKLNINNNGI